MLLFFRLLFIFSSLTFEEPKLKLNKANYGTLIFAGIKQTLNHSLAEKKNILEREIFSAVFEILIKRFLYLYGHTDKKGLKGKLYINLK